jgi:hypothetical protein
MGDDLSAGRSPGTPAQSYDRYRKKRFLRKVRYARYICADERCAYIWGFRATPRGRAYRSWRGVFGTLLVCGADSGAEARTPGENVTSLIDYYARWRPDIDSSVTAHCKYSPPTAPRTLEFYCSSDYTRRKNWASEVKADIPRNPELAATNVAPCECPANVHKSTAPLRIAVDSGSTTCGC